MSFKESYKIKSELTEKLEKTNEKISDMLYNILLDAVDDRFEKETIKEDFILWENLQENEFSFDYPFGNISLKTINLIDERFRKEGFYLKGVVSNDIYKDKKGLCFCFVKIDNNA